MLPPPCMMEAPFRCNRQMRRPSTLAVLFLASITAAGCERAGEKSPEPAPVALVAGEAGFVGTAVCAGCHEDATASWAGSHHDLAMQPADATTVLGDFGDTAFDYAGANSTFMVRDEWKFPRDKTARRPERSTRVASGQPRPVSPDGALFHIDDDLAPGASCFRVSDRLRDFGQRITSVDDRRHRSGLHKLGQEAQVAGFETRQ